MKVNKSNSVKQVAAWRAGIESGIKSMKDYQIIVCGESPNIEIEFDNYTWNDKKSGIPIDDYNHTIDPIRYALKKLTKPAGGVL